jgi:hypothetical protein
MKVINFFGGPNTGKSTQATGLFYLMKTAGYNCEVINEFAKQCVWEGQFDMLKDQLYVMAKQHRRQLRLMDQVDWCITDSPIMLSAVYRTAYNQTYYSDLIDKMAYECYCKYDNINFYLQRRDDAYEQTGREQNLEQALQIDQVMLHILNTYDIPYTPISVDDATVNTVFDIVKNLN